MFVERVKVRIRHKVMSKGLQVSLGLTPVTAGWASLGACGALLRRPSCPSPPVSEQWGQPCYIPHDPSWAKADWTEGGYVTHSSQSRAWSET